MTNRRFCKIFFPMLVVLVGEVLLGWRYVTVERIATTCQRFEVDELHNIYMMYDDHLEIRRQQKGDVLRTSNLAYGSSYQLDVSNPLKPFLFYPAQGLMITMDNSLSTNGSTIPLPEMGFEQIEWVAGSQGDHYWLWDAIANELLRVDQQFRIKNRSGNLAARLGMRIQPVLVQEENDAVYILTQQSNLIELDMFGAYRRMIPLPQGTEARIQNNQIIQRHGQHLVQMDLQTGQSDSLPVPTPIPLHLRWINGSIYQCDGQQLTISSVVSE
jgi:hypothetical protein